MRRASRAQAQVDEPRPGDLRRLGQVGDLQAVDEGLGDLARRLAEDSLEGHGAVDLIIAVPRVLGRLDLDGVGGGIVHQARERLTQALL